jgi:hypothetical protein
MTLMPIHIGEMDENVSMLIGESKREADNQRTLQIFRIPSFICRFE